MTPYPVTSRLYVGPQLSHSVLQICRWDGITHILNVADELPPDPGPDDDAYVCLKIGVKDHPSLITDIWLLSVLETGLSLLGQPRNRLYIHCHRGKNRAPSAAYLLLRGLGFHRASAAAFLPEKTAPRYANQVEAFLRNYEIATKPHSTH
jgi:hypothetical protein